MPNASTSFFGWVAFLLEKYGMLFLRGTGMTLLIALTGTALGFALGLLVAIIRTIALPEKKKTGSNVGVTLRRGLLRLAQLLMNVYIQVFRGTPMIVQAVVIYYGAQYAGVFMDTTFAAIFIISINTGAYMAEIIRGGIVSVDKGQFEAAHAIGMTHWQTMTTVVLPQAIRNILPSVGNELIVNIKDSSVRNVISVSELFFQAKSAAGTYYRYFEVYFIIAVIYLILTLSVSAILRAVEKKMDGLHVAYAIDEIFVLLRRANKYIDETTPWVLAKDPAKADRLGTVLYNLLEAIRFAAIMLEAYLPETAEKILKQLNVENGGVASLAEFGGMPVGGTVGTAEILFNRIDAKKKLEEIEAAKKAKEEPAQPETEPVTFKENIDFDAFEKVDMTVVKVLECEKVKKSKKLLRFTLDDGSGTPRQILSGIAAYYQPEELVGKTLVACTNLAPRKMMGLESCGMLLSAEKDDKLNLLMLDDAIPAGAKLC